MSLATRITILVTALLAACALVTGAAFHRAARRSLDAELQGRLDARLSWLAGALDVELEDGELQLDAPDEPPGSDAAPHWQVAATDGRVLWASAGRSPDEPMSRSRTVSFGRPDAAPLPPDRISAGDTSRDDSPGGGGRTGWAAVEVSSLPPGAADAIRGAVPDLTPSNAYCRTRVKKRAAPNDVAFEVRGTSHGRHYALRLDAAGRVLRVKDSAIDPFAEYELPTDAQRVDLVLTAQASGSEARDELARLARTLWSVGPLALALTAAGLALLIRWQLRPLARMAEQAAGIGPASGDTRIDAGTEGGGAELVRLRYAINQMIARLGEGMARERRFAADAAHELRSPLAEMRATVEVALRRPRESAEYREALEAVASGLVRLQNLVVGLLQLTRGGPGDAQGRPVELDAVLRRATGSNGTAPADRAALAGPTDNVWVIGEPELLRAAVGNVLDNAARYAPGQPPTVSVESNGAGIACVVISDRGPGVPAAERERIFEPLTRLDDARTVAGTEGFGLGLAVARTTARAFGGDLVCRARSDGASGAEFVFTLRRAAAPDDEAPVAD